MVETNTLGGKLNIAELKDMNRRLVSVNKNKTVYLFICTGVIEELVTLDKDKIIEIELRFNNEAYGYSGIRDDSSIQDAVQDVIPGEYHYQKTENLDDQDLTKIDIYSKTDSNIIAKYAEYGNGLSVTVKFDEKEKNK